MTTNAPKARMMRDEELDRPEQIECRIRLLRSQLTGPGDKVALVRRIAALKGRLPQAAGQPVAPPVPQEFLLDKSLHLWGDKKPQLAVA